MTETIPYLAMEIAVAERFNYRNNIIVPNVSNGMYGWTFEADLVICTPAGYLHEVEIKRSVADTKRDMAKAKWGKGHYCIFREIYFAIPDSIYDKCLPFIPERCGIITVGKVTNGYKTWIRRDPEADIFAKKITDSEKMKLMRLGCLRIWNLKRAIHGINRLPADNYDTCTDCDLDNPGCNNGCIGA
jgi:hypothetical protein